MYYGMLRPSEAVSLMLDECKLPDQGWGLLEFSEIRSAAGREWTDDGEVHETRGPKGGPRNAVRRVPIPPVLVQLIREHVDQFGTAPDGRLSAPTAAASACHPHCGRYYRKHARRHSPQPRSPLRWPANPTTSAMLASPGASTPEPGNARGRVGRAHCRSPVPHLRPLPRRRRRTLVHPHGASPRLAKSPGTVPGRSHLWAVTWADALKFIPHIFREP